MAVAVQGQVFPWEVASAITTDLTEVAYQWRWVNRNPFITRLAAYRSRSQEFRMIGAYQRPQFVTLAAPIVAGDTTFTLEDATYIQNGDTLELTFADSSVEMIQVIGEPNVQAMTIPVLRGDAYTTPGAAAASTQVRFVANARTGGEKNQHGFSPVPWDRYNWIQTLQYPVEVSGVLQDTTSYNTDTFAPGAATPLDAFRMNALGNMMDDLERMVVYQRGIAPTASSVNRAKTKGLRQQIQEAGTLKIQPTNFANYGPADFVRDLMENPAGKGGAPRVYFVDNSWIGGLAKWKMAFSQMNMGETVFNVRIEAMSSRVAPNAVFINAPRLKRGTIIGINPDDVYMRFMLRPSWYERGKTGDVWEGDIISRYGVQCDNPDQQVMVEGITGFAAA